MKLYKDVARRLSAAVPGVALEVFSDRDLESRRREVEAALGRADAFFGSLLFDFDQVEWLKPKLERIPVRLVRWRWRLARGTAQAGMARCTLAALTARTPLAALQVFESALELMSSTQVGSFTMNTKPGEQRGPPPAVKALLSKFGSGKEEARRRFLPSHSLPLARARRGTDDAHSLVRVAPVPPHPRTAWSGTSPS